MINEEFLDYLKDSIKIAKQEGFDKIELIHEDSDMEVYLFKGESGMGSQRNDLKSDLWDLNIKDVKILKSKLEIKNISIRDYNHFGENARKLLIKLF